MDHLIEGVALVAAAGLVGAAIISQSYTPRAPLRHADPFSYAPNDPRINRAHRAARGAHGVGVGGVGVVDRSAIVFAPSDGGEGPLLVAVPADMTQAEHNALLAELQLYGFDHNYQFINNNLINNNGYLIDQDPTVERYHQPQALINPAEPRQHHLDMQVAAAPFTRPVTAAGNSLTSRGSETKSKSQGGAKPTDWSSSDYEALMRYRDGASSSGSHSLNTNSNTNSSPQAVRSKQELSNASSSSSSSTSSTSSSSSTWASSSARYNTPRAVYSVPPSASPVSLPWPRAIPTATSTATSAAAIVEVEPETVSVRYHVPAELQFGPPHSQQQPQPYSHSVQPSSLGAGVEARYPLVADLPPPYRSPSPPTAAVIMSSNRSSAEPLSSVLASPTLLPSRMPSAVPLLPPPYSPTRRW